MSLPIGILCSNLWRWAILIQLHIFLHALGIEHMAHLTTAINLIDLGTIFQVHLGVFRPRVDTFSCAIDCGEIAFFLIRPYWRRNVYLGIERAALVIVSTIDRTRHTGFFIRVSIIHVGLVYITRWENLRAICTTKNITNLDSGYRWHIDDGSSRNTFVIAATIDRVYLSVYQIYNG